MTDFAVLRAPSQVLFGSGMAAAAVISLLPVVLLFILLQRYFVEGMAGAVKQ